MKKILNLVFLFFPMFYLSSCNSSSLKVNERPIQYIDDQYGAYYQIFPYSYADSNGDGIGDLRGIIDKFDYIKSLNYTGLWLTPVHSSPSYHKYDVVDYKSIDSSFGTLNDYDELVNKCHDNHMTIILDLVFNHSSDENRWFQKCYAAHLRNQVNDQYYNYYNFKHLSTNEATPTGYTRLSATLAYESRFNSDMPDLNLGEVLAHPDGYLAKDLKEILSFWLIDHDIDGFRLDAVTSYFTGDIDKNVSFLTWLNKECRALKKDCFIVAEGSWGNNNENKRYSESGINGCFQFDDSRADGYIAQTIAQQDSTYLAYTINKNAECVPTDNINAIAMPFITNHDLGRTVGYVSGRNQPQKVKFANGILQLLNGTTFAYYGDEIGMAVVSQTGDNAKDEDKRQPMNWGDSYTCKPVRGSSKASDKEKYPFGSLKKQINDKSSIVNYIKKANLLRLQNPEIARGKTNSIFANSDDTFAVVSKTYKNEKIYICLNCSAKKSFEYDYSSLNVTDILGVLEATTSVKKGQKSDQSIIVPPYGIVILR